MRKQADPFERHTEDPGPEGQRPPGILGRALKLSECDVIGIACRLRPRGPGHAPSPKTTIPSCRCARSPSPEAPPLEAPPPRARPRPGSRDYHSQQQLRSQCVTWVPPRPFRNRGVPAACALPHVGPGRRALGAGAGRWRAGGCRETPTPARHEPLRSAAVRAGHGRGRRRAAQVSSCGSLRRGNGGPVGLDREGGPGGDRPLLAHLGVLLSTHPAVLPENAGTSLGPQRAGHGPRSARERGGSGPR